MTGAAVESSSDRDVVRIEGEIDVVTAPTLVERILDVPPGSGRVIVDLTGATFIDSSGLSALVSCHAKLAEHGCEMRLVVERPQILKVLDVTGLSSVFPTYSTVEAARVG